MVFVIQKIEASALAMVGSATLALKA